jgi:heme oxygenase
MKSQSSIPLLEALRSHTYACHMELQGRFDVFHRIQNKDNYGSLLLKLYGFYNKVEPQITRWDSDFTRLGIDLEIRRKIPKLIADISSLDLTDHLVSRPNCEISLIPSLETFAQAVGCLYVLEGSTLGAQIICQHLRTVFRSNFASNSMNYYQGYGCETRKMWGEFCEFISHYSLEMKTVQEHEQVLASGKQTFESLGKWLG